MTATLATVNTVVRSWALSGLLRFQLYFTSGGRDVKTIAFAGLLLLSTNIAFGVTIGQTDTFEDGISSWFAGGGPFGQVPPVPPAVIPDGGPRGSGDAYLQVTSSGQTDAPGSRLVAMNGTQWAGNYLTAGVGAIQMDMINLGQTDLVMRLYFEDPIPGPPMNEAVTTFAFELAAGSGWQRAVFPVGPSDFTVLAGSATAALSNTTILRLMHNPDATFPPPALAATVGIDNVAAVPEPAVIWMTASGIAALLLARRFRRPV